MSKKIELNGAKVILKISDDKAVPPYDLIADFLDAFKQADKEADILILPYGYEAIIIDSYGKAFRL